jgi:signal transduction histidine kinase
MDPLTGIATPPRSPAVPSDSPLRAAGQAAIVLASVGVAFALTVLLEPWIARSIFVFLYAAVAVSGMYAGVGGGVAASLLSAALVDYFILPPKRSFRLEHGEDFALIVLFLVISVLVSGLVAWLRMTRQAAEERTARLREQAATMKAQQDELRLLAEEIRASRADMESAMHVANAARDEAIASEAHMRLIDEASRVLASSLDYQTTVTAVARLAVPTFADWSVVDLLVDGKIEQLAIAHVDPAKVKWARELASRYPPNPDAPAGAPAVIRTGEPQFVPVVTDEMLQASARDAENLAILREMDVGSAMIVPIATRGATLGALTLVRTGHDNPYDEREFVVALDLGRRAAAAIDNAWLYRAALAANQAKANFLATMSHELRTPLTAIIGYEELLAEGVTGSVTEPQREQLQRIKVSAMQLLALIEEILLYARVEAGRETVRVEPVVVRGVVDDALGFVAPTAGRRDIHLGSDSIDPSLQLETDSGKLRQMLVNLLANAVKFTEHGEVTVRAFADGDHVVFEVQDTGIGIEPGHLANIFDPFWQVEQHTTRTAGGSGLGLAVTRNLATLLGGTVTVDSTVGVGSTFRITLPKKPRE